MSDVRLKPLILLCDLTAQMKPSGILPNTYPNTSTTNPTKIYSYFGGQVKGRKQGHRRTQWTMVEDCGQPDGRRTMLSMLEGTNLTM